MGNFKFQKKKFKVLRHGDGMQEVEGNVTRYFGVHKYVHDKDSWWCVTHLATGKSMTNFELKRQARAYVMYLEKHHGMLMESEEDIKKHMALCQEIEQKVRNDQIDEVKPEGEDVSPENMKLFDEQPCGFTCIECGEFQAGPEEKHICKGQDNEQSAGNEKRPEQTGLEPPAMESDDGGSQGADGGGEEVRADELEESSKPSKPVFFRLPKTRRGVVGGRAA